MTSSEHARRLCLGSSPSSYTQGVVAGLNLESYEMGPVQLSSRSLIQYQGPVTCLRQEANLKGVQRPSLDIDKALRRVRKESR